MAFLAGGRAFLTSLTLLLLVRIPQTTTNSTQWGLSAEALNDLETASSLSRTTREASNVLRIGAVLDSMDHGTEQALKSGIQIANFLMQKRDQLPDHVIKAEVIWVPKEQFFSAFGEICQLLQKGVVAFISPPDPLLRQSVAMVSTQFGIPLIETHWNTERSNPRISINVHPDHDAFGQALFEYLSDYEKWRRMVLILENYESLSKFEALLNSFEGTVLVRIWGDNSTRWKEIMAELAGNIERNFLLDLPYWRVKDFLVLAFVHNMTGEQYHYVFTDWDTHLLDLSAFTIDGGPKISTFSIVPNIGVEGRYFRGQILEVLRMKINKIERAQRSSDILPFITASAALLYDAMLLFGPALLTHVQSGQVRQEPLSCDADDTFWHAGELLVNATKSMDSAELPTITGNVLFDSLGIRSDFNMSLLHLQGQGFTEVGYWNGRDGLQIVRQLPRYKKPEKKPMTTLTLRVTTLPDTPFAIPVDFDAYGQPMKNPSAWKGYCVDLLELISKDVGFNFTIQVAKDRNYGSLRTGPDGKEYYDGMVGEVLRGEADMAVAGLTITYDREKVLDFSTPFMTLGGSLLFTRPKSQKPSIFSFLQPLSPTVWAYVITTYVGVSLGLFIVARLSPYEWQNPHPCEAFSEEKENQFTILSSFWFFVSPLLNQGTEMAPHSISTRLLTGIWWFFALIIISTYTANLAAFLTVDTTKSPIESVEDLVAQTKIKYGTLKSGSSHDFFKTSKIPVFQKMWNFMSNNPDVFVANTQEGIDRVLRGDYVFVLESTWNEFYNQRNCRLMQVGRLLDSKGYGIGLPQGSPYRDAISESILKLQKSQQLDMLKRRWWMEYNISEPCTNLKDASKEASPLDIEQVGGVFVLLLIGFFWAFIVSIIEFCVHNKACMKSQRSLFSEMWKELKFAIRCMTPSTRTKPSTPPAAQAAKSADCQGCSLKSTATPGNITADTSPSCSPSSLASRNHLRPPRACMSAASTPGTPVAAAAGPALQKTLATAGQKPSHITVLESSEPSDFSTETYPEALGDAEVDFDSYPGTPMKTTWWDDGGVRSTREQQPQPIANSRRMGRGGGGAARMGEEHSDWWMEESAL
ncbi:hypothetical protein AAHC03_016425 [Spirometra sp. Aus1]